MAGTIKGITVEIGANTSKLSNALRSASAPVNKLQGELRRVEGLLKMNPGNVDLIRQKETLLAQSIEKVEGNLKEMKSALASASASGATEKNSAAFRRLQQEVVKTEAKLRQLKQESARMTVLGSNIGIAAAKMNALGQKATALGQKLRGVSVAAGLIGTAAVATVSEFDSAMSKVQAVSGATGQDFQALRDKAREMGASTKFTATEAAEAMNYMAMAGWKSGQMMSGIEGIMNLAAASGEDLATTSDIVTDALTAMGYAAKDSGRLADVMAAASSNANTNVSMMGETFKYAATVAGAMGYSMEDLALATGLMANSGIKGTQAGTSLRSIISRLAAPTGAVASEMEKLGVSITDSNGEARPFRDVLTDLRSSMSGMSETEKTAAASTIAGKNAMSGFLALINSSDKDFNKLANAIDNSGGSAEAMAQTMNDNFGGQLTILKSALQELAISMGDTLVPTMRTLASGAQALVGWFNGLSNGTKAFITKLVVLVGLLSPLLISFGAMAKLINMSVVSFANLKAALVTNTVAVKVYQAAHNGLTGVLSKCRVALAYLRAGCLAEGAAMTQGTVVTRLATIAQSAYNRVVSLGALKAKIAAGAQLALNAAMSLGPWKLIAIAIGVASAALGVFLATNENARTKLVEIFNSIKEKVTTVFENLPTLLATVGAQLQTILPQILESASAMIPQLVETLANTLPEMLGVGLEAMINFLNGMSQAVPTVIAMATTVLVQLINTLSANIGNIITVGINIMTTLVQGILGALPSLIAQLPTIILAIINGIVTAVPLLAEAAVVLIGALVTGIVKCIPQLVAALPQIITALIQGIISLAGALLSAGVQIILAIIKGVKKQGPQIAKSVWTLIKSLPRLILNIAGSLLSAGAKIIKSLYKGIKNKFGDIISAMGSLGSKIKAKLKGISLISIGKSLLSGLANGIRNGVSKCISAVSSVAKKIIGKFKSLLKINSPSKVIRDQIGLAIPEGLAAGIEKGTGLVDSAIEQMTASSLIVGANGALVTSGGQIVAGSGGNGDKVIRNAIIEGMSLLIGPMQEGMAMSVEGMALKMDSREVGRIVRRVK